MIFFIEGLSKSGKTTLINKFFEIYNNYAIRFKGDGQVKCGINSSWEDYNYYMHNIIERLDELNNYKIPILWDRGISEGIYSDYKWIRLAKAHKHKYVIYLDFKDFKTLRLRNSSELDIKKIQKVYYENIQAFNHYIIDIDNLITDNHVYNLYKIIYDVNGDRKNWWIK